MLEIQGKIIDLRDQVAVSVNLSKKGYKTVKLNSHGNVNSRDKKITVKKKITVVTMIAMKAITLIITKPRTITKSLEKESKENK